MINLALKHMNTMTIDNNLENPEETLDILYQDPFLIAIHKPANLLVHKSPIDKHETRYAMKILRDQLGMWVYPVHRLDKPTSGLLLFALHPEIAKQISESFEQRDVKKNYCAIVRGYIDEKGTVDYPLKEIAAFKHLAEEVNSKPAKNATTHYERCKTYELPFSDGRFDTSRYSLVNLYPETGRKHQLNRHLKHLSHPIIGDVKYGKGEHNRLFREQLNSHRLLLAARSLTLPHPVDNNPLTIECPLATDFEQTLVNLEQYKND